MVNVVRKGKRFEYEVRDLLRRNGFFAFLISRSKPFDLVAWVPGSERAFVIECTTARITVSKIKNFYKNVHRIPTFHLLATKKGGKVKFYEIGFNAGSCRWEHYEVEVNSLAADSG